MSYQLSGHDRDTITAFVHGEQVAACLSFVESLVNRELEVSNGKVPAESNKASGGVDGSGEAPRNLEDGGGAERST